MSDAKRRSILLIDDDLDILSALKDAIEDDGYLVETADNGQEGLSVMAGRTFDLILLDWMMPIMNGADFLIEMRRDTARAPTPVVVMSADPRLRTQVARLDIAAFLAKPVDLHQILETIARHARA